MSTSVYRMMARVYRRMWMWNGATSLGLKLIRSLVQQLQGTLTIESSDRGSTVTIDFPLRDGRMIMMSKILVVDDEAIITMQLEERLHAMGYTVVGMAASGEDAIEKARRLSPDLILMDIVMPGTAERYRSGAGHCERTGYPGGLCHIVCG